MIIEDRAYKHTSQDVDIMVHDGLKQGYTFGVPIFFSFALNRDLFHSLKTLKGSKTDFRILGC